MRVQPSASSLVRLATFLLFAAAFMGFGPGCDKKEDIRVYQAPKEAPTVAAAPRATGAGQQGQEGGESIHWTLPEGWKEVQSDIKERYATIAVAPEEPAAVMTVSRFPPSGILPNVNRWAEQLGLPLMNESELSKVLAEVETKAGKVSVVDLTAPEQSAGGKPRQRMLGGILPHGPEMWFFKLTGTKDTVEGQKAKYEAFLKSVHFDADGGHGGHGATAGAGTPGTTGGQALPPDHPPVAAAGPAAPSQPTQGPQAAQGPGQPTPGSAPQRGLARWTAPAGWVDNTANPPAGMGGMSIPRALSFQVPAAEGAADVSLIRLPAGSGTLVDNVNRWRRQVGLGPVAAVNDADRKKVTVGGAEALVFNLVGPQKGTIIALVPRGNSEWYVKITGPAAVVTAQRDAFRSFLSSIEFAGE